MTVEKPLTEFVKTILQNAKQNMTPAEWASFKKELLEEQVKEERIRSDLDYDMIDKEVKRQNELNGQNWKV